MVVMILILLAFAPGLFWLWYFYQRDRLEPEPKRLILKMFLLGMVMVIPAAILELPFLWAGQFLPILVAPVVEEFIKFIIVKKTIYDHREFNEPMDGIIYAAAVALGFASVENVGYLLQAFHSGTFVFAFTLRALLSVPGHVLFSAMWGYALGLAKFSSFHRKQRTVQSGLILSMVLHGVFNFLAGTWTLLAFGMIFFIIYLWRMVNRKIRVALRLSEQLHTEVKL